MHPSEHAFKHLPVQSEQYVAPEPVPEQVVVQKPLHNPLQFVEDCVLPSNLVIGLFISSYFISLPSAYEAFGTPVAYPIVSAS